MELHNKVIQRQDTNGIKPACCLLPLWLFISDTWKILYYNSVKFILSKPVVVQTDIKNIKQQSTGN